MTNISTGDSIDYLIFSLKARYISVEAEDGRFIKREKKRFHFRKEELDQRVCVGIFVVGEIDLKPAESLQYLEYVVASLKVSTIVLVEMFGNLRHDLIMCYCHQSEQ